MQTYLVALGVPAAQSFCLKAQEVMTSACRTMSIPATKAVRPEIVVKEPFMTSDPSVVPRLMRRLQSFVTARAQESVEAETSPLLHAGKTSIMVPVRGLPFRDFVDGLLAACVSAGIDTGRHECALPHFVVASGLDEAACLSGLELLRELSPLPRIVTIGSIRIHECLPSGKLANKAGIELRS